MASRRAGFRERSIVAMNNSVHRSRFCAGDLVFLLSTSLITAPSGEQYLLLRRGVKCLHFGASIS